MKIKALAIPRTLFSSLQFVIPVNTAYLNLNGRALEGIKEERQNLCANVLPARLLQDYMEIF